MSQNETSYHRILREAADATRTHHERMAAKARAHYRKHPHESAWHEVRMLGESWWRFIPENIARDAEPVNRPTEYNAHVRLYLSQFRRKQTHSAQTMQPPSRAWCSGCKAWKSEMDFWANRSTRSGLDNLCKHCRAEATAAYRKNAA